MNTAIKKTRSSKFVKEATPVTEAAPFAAPPLPGEGDLKIKVRRSKDEFSGIILFLQSASIEAYMKSICTNRSAVEAGNKDAFLQSTSSGWGNVLGYKLSEKTVDQDPILRQFHAWGKELRLESNKPNMSFLRAKGLSEGVEFKLPGMYSETTIKEWAKSFTESYAEFYKKFTAPLEIELEFITRQKVDLTTIPATQKEV